MAGNYLKNPWMTLTDRECAGKLDNCIIPLI